MQKLFNWTCPICFALTLMVAGCGSDGADGDQGDVGLQGEKGDPGEKGEKGDQGEKGDKGDFGAKGEKGEKGEKGDQGDAGVDGAAWHQGSGAPEAAAGEEGDFYLDSDTGDVYLKKSTGWEKVANIKGENGEKGDQGEPGADGATWSQGSGAPGAEDGAVGDFYIDVDSGNIYQKGEDGWEVVANIKGGGAIPGCDANAAPVIDNLSFISNMCQGGSQTFTVDASDADADPLTYQFLGTAGVDISAGTGAESRTLQAIAVGGPYYVTVTVSDGCVTTTQQIKIYISRCNVWGQDRIGGAPGREQSYAVASDENSGALVAGSTYDQYGGTDCEADFECGDTLDVFLSFYGFPYTYKRTIVFGSDKNDAPSDIVVDYSNGNFFVIGQTSGDLDDQINADAEGDTEDIFVVKFNSSGTKQWTKLFGTAALDIPGEASLSDGFLYIAAKTSGDFGGATSAGGDDALLLKVSADDGSLAWSKQWGSDKNERLDATDFDSAGDIYAVGVNTSDEIVTLAKFKPDGTLVYSVEDWTDKFNADIAIDRDETDGDRIFVAAQGSYGMDHELFEVSGADGSIVDQVTLLVDDGTRPTQINGVALGRNGEPYVCGTTLTDTEAYNAYLGILDVSGEDMVLDTTATWGSSNQDSCNDIHGFHDLVWPDYFIRLTGEWGVNLAVGMADYYLTTKWWM